MNYKNKPILFSKIEIPRIKAELEEEIPKIIEEFNMFFNCNEPINIKYDFEEHEKGYSCSGDLYFGDQKIRHYEEIDLLVYDLNKKELDLIIKQGNSTQEEEEKRTMTNKLISITKDMWGNEPQVFNTKVKGIYDTSTSRHGGYLVDINIHPELKKYGCETNEPSIRAFEEDYEALKVLWLYPELINNTERVSEWLNSETVIKYDSDDRFIKDFPKRNVIEDEEREEENER